MDHKKNITGRIDEIVASIIGVVRAMAAANAPLAQKLFLYAHHLAHHRTA
jgi:hypothetical protein